MQRAIQIPSYLVGALNGLVVIFVVSAEHYKPRLSRYLTRNRSQGDPSDTDPEAVAVEASDEVSA